jgi:hypothetical protein
LGADAVTLGSEAFIRKARRGATANLGLVTVGLLAVCIPAWGAYQWWAFRHELRTDWVITGPPCPLATHSWESIALRRAPHRFDYGGMSVAFAFGAADCSPVPEDYFTGHAYSVCQFTAPGIFSVTAAGRRVTYEPGYGRRATVKLRGGQLSCVLAGWYRE